MIGKVKLGNFAKGILEYCYYEKKKMSDAERQKLSLSDVRGEIIYVQNLGLNQLPDGRFDVDYLAKQFLGNREMNKNLTKFIWHQSFSFPENEQPTNENIQEIVQDFAKKFGFEDNQLIVFKHHDTAHNHFHIVANRINLNGKNTADHFKNYQRTGEFCRMIEQKMGFQIAPQMHILKDKKQEPVAESEIADFLRNKINAQLPKVSTMLELKMALKKDGIKGALLLLWHRKA